MSRRLRASIGVDGMRRITQRAMTRTQQAATVPGASSRRRSASCLSSCNTAPQWPRVSHRPAAAQIATAIEAATMARRCNVESAMLWVFARSQKFMKSRETHNRVCVTGPRRRQCCGDASGCCSEWLAARCDGEELVSSHTKGLCSGET